FCGIPVELCCDRQQDDSFVCAGYRNRRRRRIAVPGALAGGRRSRTIYLADRGQSRDEVGGPRTLHVETGWLGSWKVEFQSRAKSTNGRTAAGIIAGEFEPGRWLGVSALVPT